MTLEEFMRLQGIRDPSDAELYRNYLIRLTKNTALARKLARIYKEHWGVDFPGGETNAFILRYRPGHWQRSAGAASWSLCAISNYWRLDSEMPLYFESSHPAVECAKNPDLIGQ
jgi:hypothetical protein